MPEKTVTFKFSEGDKVKTAFGEMGIVEWSAVDIANIKQHSVLTKSGANWQKEDTLTLWEE